MLHAAVKLGPIISSQSRRQDLKLFRAGVRVVDALSQDAHRRIKLLHEVLPVLQTLGRIWALKIKVLADIDGHDYPRDNRGHSHIVA